MLLIIPLCILYNDANCICACLHICMDIFPLRPSLFIFWAYLTASFCPSVLTLRNHTQVWDHKQGNLHILLFNRDHSGWAFFIFFWTPDLSSRFLSLYNAVGFHHPRTLRHWFIKTSTTQCLWIWELFAAMFFNPLIVIGTKTNQRMLSASMEIKTHGHYSAQRIRYGVKWVRCRHSSPSE